MTNYVMSQAELDDWGVEVGEQRAALAAELQKAQDAISGALRAVRALDRLYDVELVEGGARDRVAPALHHAAVVIAGVQHMVPKVAADAAPDCAFCREAIDADGPDARCVEHNADASPAAVG